MDGSGPRLSGSHAGRAREHSGGWKQVGTIEAQVCSESWLRSHGWVDCLWPGQFRGVEQQACQDSSTLVARQVRQEGWGRGVQMPLGSSSELKLS